MEMVGQCHICGRPARNTCSICGLLTCDKHIKNGVCDACRGGVSDKNSQQEKFDKDNVYH
ncbi:MAG: orotate phosphoribosyltransferase [Thermoplasmata archaeon]